MFKPDYVLIDNLISLCPGGAQEKKWENLRGGLKELAKRHNIGFILFHHSNKENDAAGSRNITNLCQTIVKLDGLNELKKYKQAGNIPEPFAPYLEKSGALFMATIAKCKAYPDLNAKSFGAFLEYNKATPSEGSNWELIRLDNVDDGSEVCSTAYGDLSPESSELLKSAQAKPYFTRSDVEKWVACKATKANSLITELCAKGLIDSMGKGKSTKYCLRRE